MLIADGCAEQKQNLMSSQSTIFRDPLAQYPAAELQAYFRQRQKVKFFPVFEAEQSDRAFIEAVLQNQFRFNNESHSFGQSIHWLDNPSDDIEWLIMLHKGYYLVGLGKLYRDSGDARYQDKWIELTDSWIAQVDDPGFIASDVTGRRIQNWIYAFYYFVCDNPHKPRADFFFTAVFDFIRASGQFPDQQSGSCA